MVHPSRMFTVSTGVLAGAGDDGVCAAALLRNPAAIEKRQNVLYVLGNKGMAVLDTTDPAKPQRIGKKISTGVISESSGAAGVFHGKYMYLAGGKGLKVFDAQTDVFQPVPVGEVIDTGALSRKGGVALQIVDNYLYVAGGKGLAVLSLADPAAPVLLPPGVISTACRDVISNLGNVRICVSGTILRVLGGKGVVTLSIADPASPQMLQKNFETGAVGRGGCCSSNGVAIDCADAPDGSWIVAGTQGVAFYNTTGAQLEQTSDIIQTGVINISGPVAMVVSDHTLYLAGGKGLGVFPLADGVGIGKQSSLIKIDTGVIARWSVTIAMLLEGTTLWIASSRGLAAFDVTKFGTSSP